MVWTVHHTLTLLRGATKYSHDELDNEDEYPYPEQELAYENKDRTDNRHDGQQYGDEEAKEPQH